MFLSKKIDFSTLSDERLMEFVSKGERSAFEILYDRYFKKLVWFAKGFVEDLHIAEDLVQDVFVKIIEKPELFNTDKKFSTWVYVVTANLCKQTLRNQKNRLRILEENKNTEISEPSINSLDSKALKERIHQVYKTLSDKERNLYTLRFEQELSIAETAEIMDIPEGSVKSGIYYLLKKFANHLKEYNHG